MRLQVREQYPMNGEERQHRRRDLRKGERPLLCHMLLDLAFLLAICGSHPALYT